MFSNKSFKYLLCIQMCGNFCCKCSDFIAEYVKVCKYKSPLGIYHKKNAKKEHPPYTL